MKNLKNTIAILILTTFGFTAANAGSFGIGVTGSYAAVKAEGTESDKDGATDLSAESVASLRSATAHNDTIIGSVFAEYSMDNGFTVGLDYIPGSADVNSKSLSRTDVTADVKEVQGQDDGARTAQAEVENHYTIYAELPVHAGMYIKGGYVEMDVNTLESNAVTAGGSTYGNTTVDGILFGLGYKNSFGSNGYYKLEGSHTEFDTISLASSEADKGNNISADLDVTKLTFALGYAF